MKALVLLSGGVDSCVALWWALQKKMKVEALTIDYRLRSRSEREATAAIARRAKVRLQSIPLGSVSSLEDLVGAQRAAIGRSAPDGFIPAKNLIFYGLGVHHAMRRGAKVIIGGHTAEDGVRFPDASRRFFDDLRVVIRMSAPRGRQPPRLVMPLISMSKRQVVRLGARLGAPLELAWSCYRDLRTPCERCPACIGRREAFKLAEVSQGRR